MSGVYSNADRRGVVGCVSVRRCSSGARGDRSLSWWWLGNSHAPAEHATFCACSGCWIKLTMAVTAGMERREDTDEEYY